LIQVLVFEFRLSFKIQFLEGAGGIDNAHQGHHQKTQRTLEWITPQRSTQNLKTLTP
jgi:hypothetical protein